MCIRDSTYTDPDKPLEYILEGKVADRSIIEHIPALFVQEALFFDPKVQAVWRGRICNTVISSEATNVEVRSRRTVISRIPIPILSDFEKEDVSEDCFSSLQTCSTKALVDFSYSCDQGPFLSSLHAHYHFAEASAAQAGDTVTPPLASVAVPRIEGLGRQSLWLQLPHDPMIEVVIPSKTIRALVAGKPAIRWSLQIAFELMGVQPRTGYICGPVKPGYSIALILRMARRMSTEVIPQ